jgi:twitching motility protein PilT
MTLFLPNDVAKSPIGGWLQRAISTEASDLHLVAGYPPVLRTHGRLTAIENETALDETSLVRSLYPLLPSPDTLDQLQIVKNMDYAVEARMADVQWRFRVNLFLSSQAVGACLRIVS